MATFQLNHNKILRNVILKILVLALLFQLSPMSAIMEIIIMIFNCNNYEMNSAIFEIYDA